MTAPSWLDGHKAAQARGRARGADLAAMARLGEPEPEAVAVVVDALAQLADLEPPPPDPGARCSYCGHTAQLATCCQAHPDTLICRLCREAKRPGNHRPPTGPLPRPRADERQPPYATQRSPRLHPDEYREMLEALAGTRPPLVPCEVCGGLMVPSAQRAHASCATPGVRDVAPVVDGPRLELVAVVDAEVWREAQAAAHRSVAAVESAAEVAAAVLEPLHGPPRPVDVELRPGKAWTDWGAAVQAAFPGSVLGVEQRDGWTTSTELWFAPPTSPPPAPGPLAVDDDTGRGPRGA